MKFLHLADLHIGKRVYGFSMIDEQRHALSQAVDIAVENDVDAVLICGDVYDRGVPPIEALDVFDDFVTSLSERGITIFAIAGNHDSPERLTFGRRIMEKGNVHFSGAINGNELSKVELADEYGAINIYMMPYQRIQDATEALLAQKIADNERCIILSHQFVTNGRHEPLLGGSESKVSVGGIDNIDAELFDGFGYVALGHIHRCQKVGKDTIRYSGAPLCYSFSEAGQEKGALIIDYRAQGDISVAFAPIRPLTPFCEIKAQLSDLVKSDAPRMAFCHITLLDDGPILDAIGKVREIYPNTMLLEFANKLAMNGSFAYERSAEEIKAQSPYDLFSIFFEEQCGTPLSEQQAEMFRSAMAESDAQEIQ